MNHIEQSASTILEKILQGIEAIKSSIIEKEKPFITMDEASEYLRLSKFTLYSYTSKGVIPFYKLQGRKIYFSINDLNEFILNKNNRIKSNSEIELEALNKMIKEKVR